MLSSDLKALPQRGDAERCGSTESGRRCVLPPGHEGGHVMAPTVAVVGGAAT